MSSIARLGLAMLAATSASAAFALNNNVEANYQTVGPTFTQGFGRTLPASPEPTETKPVNWGSTTSANFNFYDDYVFSLSPVSDGTLSAAAVTINLGNFLGIDNFQARIYNIGSTADLTNDAPAAGTLAVAWSAPLNSNGLSGTTLAFGSMVPLQAGKTYTLEFRGLVTGSGGGSYGGNLNISPVPESAGWTLALVGLGGLAFLRRHRATSRPEHA